LVAVLAVALVTGALVLGGGGGSDDASVAIGPRQTAATVPNGWQTQHPAPGITISMPAEWQTEVTSTTPTGTPLLNVVDLADAANSVLAGCTAGRGGGPTPTSAGSIVTLWEFPGDAKQVTGVDDASLDVVDRPETFAGALVAGPTQCDAARYDQIAFRD